MTSLSREVIEIVAGSAISRPAARAVCNVAWRASLERLTHDRIENIGVFAAHFGLGVNPASWIVIADRLAQPDGAWRPFEPTSYRRYLYTGVQNIDRPAPPRGFERGARVRRGSSGKSSDFG